MFFHWNFLKPVLFLGLVFWSLRQLTFFKQSSCTLPWPDVADFLNWHLVSCAERHVQYPLTFQQASGFFCFIRRPLAFSNSSNKHDLFRLAPKQTRRPVKTPREKMWWKKKANCQTVNCTTCLLLKPWKHMLRHWQTHSVHFLSEDTNNLNIRDHLKLGCVLYYY